MKTALLSDTKMISYCGFYCAECPTLKKGKCEACKGYSENCAFGLRSCKVRPCCIENGYSSCVECSIFNSVKDCKKYNPLLIRIMQFLFSSNRRLGIEMIQKKGETEFAKFMADKGWVTVKTKFRRP